MQTPNNKEGWIERFDSKRPREDESLDKEGISETYDFGYKHTEERSIHEVTDWGNIKKFIEKELTLTKQETEEKCARIYDYDIDVLISKIEIAKSYYNPVGDERNLGRHLMADEITALLKALK